MPQYIPVFALQQIRTESEKWMALRFHPNGFCWNSQNNPAQSVRHIFCNYYVNIVRFCFSSRVFLLR